MLIALRKGTVSHSSFSLCLISVDWAAHSLCLISVDWAVTAKMGLLLHGDWPQNLKHILGPCGDELSSVGKSRIQVSQGTHTRKGTCYMLSLALLGPLSRPAHSVDHPSTKFPSSWEATLTSTVWSLFCLNLPRLRNALQQNSRLPGRLERLQLYGPCFVLVCQE